MLDELIEHKRVRFIVIEIMSINERKIQYTQQREHGNLEFGRGHSHVESSAAQCGSIWMRRMHFLDGEAQLRVSSKSS